MNLRAPLALAGLAAAIAFSFNAQAAEGLATQKDKISYMVGMDIGGIEIHIEDIDMDEGIEAKSA